MMMPLIRNAMFLVIGLVLVHAANAKTITETDIREYMQDPIFVDLWFGIYDQHNEKYGWWNANEYREGQFWVFEEKTEIKLLDRVAVGKKTYDDQTVIRTHKKEYYDIGNGFLLRRVVSRFEHGEEIQILTADISDGRAQVEVDNDGQTFSYAVDGFSLSLDEVYQVELLLRKFSDWAVGDTIGYKYYDLDTFEISEETDIVRGVEETIRDGVHLKYYQVETLQSDARYTFKTTLAEDGTPLKYSEVKGHTDLEEEHQAKSNVVFGGLTFEDSVVKVDQSFPDVKTISTLTLEIVGPYEDGIHTGYQQKVVTKNGKTILVLGDKIGSREPGVAKDAAKYLRQSSLYPVEDPAIQKMTRDLVAGVADDRKKVRILLDYVDRYIVDDYTSNSMSVFEVLEKRKGDCSEHTLLFNTLARAAGIPSREVRGLINYDDRKFGLHAWNEVLIDGEWHSVDATWGYMSTPITHIRFEGNNYIPPSFEFRIVDIERTVSR